MHLFEPIKLAGVQLKNRIVVSPMCQYSATDGVPNPWHLVHLGSRAVGGASLVIAEASAVEARGRITAGDAGIYNDTQVEAWAPITKFIKEQGSVAGIQLAHAGRKASTSKPWEGGKDVKPENGGWRPVLAPSAIAFSDTYPEPTAMTTAQIEEVIKAFADSAKRAVSAGFEVLELHGAHGYLMHEFHSPISNQRKDEYGGSLENRTRFTRRVIAAVRAVIPESMPLFLRISATDWVPDGGWDLEQSVSLVESIKNDGVTLIDVSSGGTSPAQKLPSPLGPGYQTHFSAEIRRRTGARTGTVGLITSPHQADHIVRTEQADVVLLARELLRDPYWPLAAAKALGVKTAATMNEAPVQYQRAW